MSTDAPLWETDPERWVTERARYLSSRDVGLRESVAEAVAWHEVGRSASGVARETGVSEGVAKNRLKRANEEYPGILVRSAADLGGPQHGMDDLPEAASSARECPVCLMERVCAVWEAQRVFKTSGWGATSMLEDADLVCSYCHAVRIRGTWDRMSTVDSRAYQLSQSGNHPPSHYRDILTQGIEPGAGDEPSVEAEDW